MLARNSRARAAAKTPGTNNGTAMLELGLAVLQARRTALVTARDDRQLDDEIMREAIEAIDLQEAVLATWEPETPED
jgi:CPA1 family monovalent cation:H+ antiporter